MKKIKFNKLMALTFTITSLFIFAASVQAEKTSDLILIDPCEGFSPLSGYDTEIFCGELKGAGYRIEVPSNWNGDLFVWSHGLRLYSTYLYVDNPPIREWLINNGYAWAASSYSANELDISIGVIDTHALTLFFNGVVAVPEHIYIGGESMGGAVTVNAIEQYPNLFDGAMPLCGTLDTYENLDYAFDYYVISTALAGIESSFPIPQNYSSEIYPQVKANLELIPGTFPFTLNPNGEQLKITLEMLGGGDRPTFDQGFLFWYGILAVYPGQVPGNFIVDFGTFGEDDLISVSDVKGNFIDNTDKVYQFDYDPALSPAEQTFNEIVLRVASDPQAIHPAGLKNIPTAQGTLSIPVLTMHTLGDLFVPVSMEQIYAQRVASHGASNLLVQRAIRDFVHCGFTEEEVITGFVDLVNWVENGIKPAGDDFLDPVAVADPYFGCTFTTEDRVYPYPLSIPSCP